MPKDNVYNRAFIKWCIRLHYLNNIQWATDSNNRTNAWVGINKANGTHTSPTHTIYYPNHPVYDLDLPQGSLNRVGDNVDPKQGKLDND